MPPHNLKFLVIDPDLLAQEDIHDAIEKIGYGSAVGVSSVREGLQALHEQPPGFVICDWSDENGPEIGFMKVLRAVERFRDMRLLVISRTAANSSERIRRATAAGANGFLFKPFDAEGLREAIDEVLEATGYQES
jgi:two-component system chemotaxis response regulator CheY